MALMPKKRKKILFQKKEKFYGQRGKLILFMDINWFIKSEKFTLVANYHELLSMRQHICSFSIARTCTAAILDQPYRVRHLKFCNFDMRIVIVDTKNP